MPAKEEEAIIDATSLDLSITIIPHHIPSPSPSEYTSSNGSDSDSIEHLTPVSNVVYEKIQIPLEPNLKDVLKKVTGTDNLSTLTQVKLQVIAADVCLQHISIHMPQLTELNLDGSILSSLRDLGCGLQNLKILHVSRCGLTSLDGMFGLQSLEQLFAGNNTIQDLSPCTCLPYVQRINLRRNCIKDISSVSFLTLCTTLEHLALDENEDIIRIPEYRQIIKTLLPNLKTLDGEDLVEDKDFTETIRAKSLVSSKLRSGDPVPSTSVAKEGTAVTKPYRSLIKGSFTVRFPPKVLSPRPSSGSSSDSNIATSYRSELPDIESKSSSPEHSSANTDKRKSVNNNKEKN